MSFDILYNDSNDGVAPGGLHDVEDIKILICYEKYTWEKWNDKEKE